MEKKLNKKENCRGEVMLESLVVYTITIFLLVAILALFSALYQRWNVQTIANEAAARYAQTYRFYDKDISSGYVTEEQMTAVPHYRYSTNSLENCARSEITSYIKGRLSRTTYTQDVTEPKITVSVSKDDVSRRHIEVTIEGEYKVPLGEALTYFGMGKSLKYKATAYSECIDLIDYINTTDFVETQIEDNILNSGIVSYIDSILSLWTNLTSDSSSSGGGGGVGGW